MELDKCCNYIQRQNPEGSGLPDLPDPLPDASRTEIFLSVIYPYNNRHVENSILRGVPRELATVHTYIFREHP
ncbi:hypothetical protein CEXT_459441 [Caerostris extrusa]|uniref:Uncharacterized protein n=1 Tax=Caerostris extrusa TaxID=172846 RepID=A0AAV4TZL7_CAEEX|nr:hypothetical protein CEXT_459441 [Caerostris extrusa]